MQDPEMQELNRIYNLLSDAKRKEFLKQEIERLKKELGYKAPTIDPLMQFLTSHGIKCTDMSRKPGV